MTEATVTFRVDAELRAAFAEAARSADRTGAQLLRDFMRDYVKRQRIAAEEETRFRAQVQQGLDEIAAGLGVPHEEAEKEFAPRRAAARRRAREL